MLIWKGSGTQIACHDFRSGFTASLGVFPVLNDGNFDADIEIDSPVRGVRTVRACRGVRTG